MNLQQMKFKQPIAVSMVLLLTLITLTACGGQKLSDDFDETTLKATAEDVIQIIVAKENDKLREISNATMSEALTDDVLSQIYAAIDEGGPFKEITDMSIAGTKDPETEEEFAVVVTKAQYENRPFIYTMTFTKQMKLAGLFYK